MLVEGGGGKKNILWGQEPWSSGYGFKSQYRIIDGHLSHIFVLKIVIFVWKGTNKPKRVRDGTFFIRRIFFLNGANNVFLINIFIRVFSDSRTFSIHDFFQFLKVTNWNKHPCQLHWQRGYLGLATAARFGIKYPAIAKYK